MPLLGEKWISHVFMFSFFVVFSLIELFKKKSPVKEYCVVKYFN